MDETDEKAIWRIVLEGVEEDDDDDMELIFTDTSNLLGEPTIERKFIDSIIVKTAKLDHYSLFKNLKKIISDSNEDVTNLAIWMLLGVVQENQQKVGFLLGALPNGNIHIVAAWPNTFIDQLRSDPKLLEEVLERFSNDPEFWKQVDLIVGYS